MFKQFLVIALLLSIVLISGCTQQADTTTTTTTTGAVITSVDEDQAAGMIEQELENATEGIDTSDIEGLIPE